MEKIFAHIYDGRTRDHLCICKSFHYFHISKRRFTNEFIYSRSCSPLFKRKYFMPGPLSRTLTVYHGLVFIANSLLFPINSLSTLDSVWWPNSLIFSNHKQVYWQKEIRETSGQHYFRRMGNLSYPGNYSICVGPLMVMRRVRNQVIPAPYRAYWKKSSHCYRIRWAELTREMKSTTPNNSAR